MMILPSRELMPIVRAALERGQRVRMTVTGGSMFPFLRDGDVVELEPALTLRLGDMVLVQTDSSDVIERYVLHRIVRWVDGAAFPGSIDEAFLAHNCIAKDRLPQMPCWAGSPLLGATVAPAT